MQITHFKDPWCTYHLLPVGHVVPGLVHAAADGPTSDVQERQHVQPYHKERATVGFRQLQLRGFQFHRSRQALHRTLRQTWTGQDNQLPVLQPPRVRPQVGGAVGVPHRRGQDPVQEGHGELEKEPNLRQIILHLINKMYFTLNHNE